MFLPPPDVIFIGMFDTHVHLDFDPFYDRLGEVTSRMAEAGVTGALVPAVDLASSARAAEISRAYPWILAGLGIHPLHVGGYAEPPLTELEALAADGGYSAVGEVGLDFWNGRGDEEVQREFFAVQAAFAQRLGLPLLLHCRKSLYETLALMRESGFTGPAVVHAFSGGWEMARTALDRGCYLSACAVVTRPGKERLREALRKVPSERLLTETDAPDLPPWERRGETHHPWELPVTVRALAGIRGENPAATADYTFRNAMELFTKKGKA